MRDSGLPWCLAPIYVRTAALNNRAYSSISILTYLSAPVIQPQFAVWKNRIGAKDITKI